MEFKPMIHELIQIKAFPKHEPLHEVEGANYIYKYAIHITNHSTIPVQLMRRKWVIADGTEIIREVEGEGVVGEQPIINPSESYEYQSWCPMVEEIGNMSGEYIFLDLLSMKEFTVDIPPFVLQPDFTLN